MSRPYLSQNEAARLLGIKPTTLRNWRHRKFGPPYARIGGPQRGRPVYLEEDILSWIRSQVQQFPPAAEAPAAEAVSA